MKNNQYLADLDGGGSARETGQAGLEGGHLTEGPPAARVHAGHAELVGRPRLQLLLLQVAVVRHVDHVNVLFRSFATQTSVIDLDHLCLGDYNNENIEQQQQQQKHTHTRKHTQPINNIEQQKIHTHVYKDKDQH